jgi:hypothetical protein
MGGIAEAAVQRGRRSSGCGDTRDFRQRAGEADIVMRVELYGGAEGRPCG